MLSKLCFALTVCFACFASDFTVRAEEAPPAADAVSDEFDRLLSEEFEKAHKGDITGTIARVEAILESGKYVDAQRLGWAYFQLGNLRSKRGDYVNAESDLEAAVNLLSQPTHRDILKLQRAYNDLAGVESALGRYEAAEAHFLKAISLENEQVKPNQDRLATRYNNLSILYNDLHRFSEAEVLLRKAIEIGRLKENNEASLASRYGNLGIALAGMGRSDEAEAAYNTAAALEEKIRPANHPKLAVRYGVLARFYFNQGRLEEAEPLILRALKIDLDARPKDHPRIASWRSYLGSLYKAQKRYDESRLQYEEAIRLFNLAFGDNNLHSASVYNNMGGLEMYVGDQEAAYRCHRKAYEILKEIHGRDIKPYAIVAYNYYRSLLATGRSEEADELARALGDRVQ